MGRVNLFAHMIKSDLKSLTGFPDYGVHRQSYGTTPLEESEWIGMLTAAGLRAIETECEPWSRPEMFWKIRKERNVKGPSQVLTLPERIATAGRVFRHYGLKGVFKVFENERIFYRAILDGKLGYCLFKGTAR